ncbi:hypothetical protein BJ138DRAFT_1198541, partial [Hygrophoropsis aurantiaca]
PSEYWLKNPAWVDGGVNPPRFYHSHEEINRDRLTAGYPALSHVTDSAPHVRTPTTSSTMPEASMEQLAHRVAPSKSAALEATGHLVSATTLVTSIDKPVSSGRGNRMMAKKAKSKLTKSDHIVLEGISRTKFIESILTIHDLADKYRPGSNLGPEFKMWWSGSSGGKAGASTIENDHDFDVALAAILKRKKDMCHVSVEFDLDTMDGFRIRSKRGFPQDDDTSQANDEELSYGTKVPRKDLFTEEVQLHSKYILQLKSKWPCQKHQGEHGEPGYCYVSPTGEHLGLNNRKLKIWAAAIAAADATKHQPPNTVDFDGIRDGRLSSIKPRGRTGPTSTSSTSSSDSTALLMAAILPFITSNLASRSPLASPSVEPSTPTHQRHLSVTPQSPLPEPGSEIRTCLRDFLKAKDIDLTNAEQSLKALELTPDIIADVPVGHLCEVMAAVEGRVRKFQVFCKVWSDRLEDKKQRGL